MARLFKLLLLATLLLIVAVPAVVYVKVLSPTPQPLGIEPADQEELMRVQQMITDQVRQADSQGRVQLRLGQQDVNTAIEFFMLAGGPPQLEGVAAQIGEGDMTVRGNIDLPLPIARHFIQYEATLTPDGKTPHIESLKLGTLAMPAFILRRVETRAYEMLASDERLELARKGWESIEDITIDYDQLVIDYRLTPATIRGLAKQHSKLLLEQVDPRSVAYYLAELEPYSRKAASGKHPLTSMLAPAFELAQQRSNDGYDPIMENSAALFTLAMYVTKPDVIESMGLSERFGYPARQLTLTLYRRNDLANHFLTSAMISLFAGDQVAMLMGMQKELEDSQRATGFDVADLMADKAGIRFAEIATANESSARRLQEKMVQVLYDDEIMPNPKNLPVVDEYELANLNDRELEAYLKRMENQLNQLLASVALYRG